MKRWRYSFKNRSELNRSFFMPKRFRMISLSKCSGYPLSLFSLSLNPEWHESSSGELRQIETIKRLIWDTPALCVAPTGTRHRPTRVCIAQQYYRTVQTRAGKTNNAPRPGGRLQRWTPGPHTPSPNNVVRTCVCVDRNPTDGWADRDRAYASEIALNGRTKALNNAAIITDGILSIRERLIYLCLVVARMRSLIHIHIYISSIFTQ